METHIDHRIAKYERQLKQISVAKRVLLIVLAILIVAICQISFVNDRYAEWYDSRYITEVVVYSGDTLDGFGYQYKPKWMDVREYREYILELNGLTSSALYIGQTLKLYVIDTH